MLSNRAKIVWISPYSFAWSIRDASRFKVIRGVPRDADLVRHGYDENRQMFYFVFTHDAFDEVPEGASIPELEVEVENDRGTPPDAKVKFREFL